MVSTMSSMNCCSAALFSSALSMARALARRTGWPMRATFRIDMVEFYTEVLRA